MDLLLDIPHQRKAWEEEDEEAGMFLRDKGGAGGDVVVKTPARCWKQKVAVWGRYYGIMAPLHSDSFILFCAPCLNKENTDISWVVFYCGVRVPGYQDELLLMETDRDGHSPSWDNVSLECIIILVCRLCAFVDERVCFSVCVCAAVGVCRRQWAISLL